MNEETATFSKAPSTGDSSLFNVTIRGWIVLLLVLTVCVMSGLGKEVVEPLYGLAYLATGYYFGQKTQKQTP